MPRFFVKNEQIKENNIIIINEDVKHIKNVLRKQIGDILEICNSEDQNAYNCKITKITDTEIVTNIIEKLIQKETKIKVDIYQGLPKADKMELIIQKAVELGVNSIIPTKMKRCVVKIDEKDENKKIERWQKIAESAAKQSGRTIIPEIKNIKDILDIDTKDYNLVIVAYENEKEHTLKQELRKIANNQEIKIAVVIGPEGGIEEKEIQNLKQKGAKIVTLGNKILRTETVALNILSILMYEFEQ